MEDIDEKLSFLQNVAKKISDRSSQGSPISKEKVFDVFNETLDEMTTVRVIEVPVFMPFKVEKEKDRYVAHCDVYRMCKGLGKTEAEAIERLKEDIELYNKG